MSLNQKIDQLEQTALTHLENPDGVSERVSYRFDLSDDFTLRLESEAKDDEAAFAGTWLEQPRLSTSVFISHLGSLAQRRQRNAMAFSCLYDHKPEEAVHGIQHVAPSELPVPISVDDLVEGPRIDYRKNLHMIALTDNERAFYVATLGLARFIDEYTANDVKYTHPPVDNEAIMTCSDEDSERYEEWDDMHQFILSLSADDIEPIQKFLRTANILLAEGTISRDAHISRAYPITSSTDRDVPVREVFIESHEVSERRPRALGKPAVKIAISEYGVEHVFERSKTGRVEVRFHNADIVERYSGLKSFDPVYEDDGTLSAFSWSGGEYAELEEQERATGLFEPTAETVNFFLERITYL